MDVHEFYRRLKNESSMSTEELIYHMTECLQSTLNMAEMKEQYYTSDDFTKTMFLKTCNYLHTQNLLKEFDWSAEACDFAEYINNQNEQV